MQNESFPNVLDGRKVVTVAGTAERLVSANTPARKVEITAEVDNTDYVVVGGSTVDATTSTRRGTPLMAGQTITMYVTDLYPIFIDAVVSGEGVTYTYFF